MLLTFQSASRNFKLNMPFTKVHTGFATISSLYSANGRGVRNIEGHFIAEDVDDQA